MNHRHIAAVLLVAAATTPLAAQTVVAPTDVTAGEVAAAPLETLNLRKDEIPPILIAAREHTYAIADLQTCRAIAAEIGRLDAVLGPDIDVAVDQTKAEKRGNAVGAVAKSVINGFIPFGGVIRQVTGAAAKEHQWQVSLYAGASRRAFLKGYGQARGCRYPARAATPALAAAIKAGAIKAGAEGGNAPPPPVPATPAKKTRQR